MNAITLALERLFADLRDDRTRVEMALSLGATYQEATAEMVRQAIRTGMTPFINTLMTIGLVSLPGMMTGQSLAGSDPGVASEYQIVGMLMLVASTAISSSIVVHVVRRTCFTGSSQLILR